MKKFVLGLFAVVMVLTALGALLVVNTLRIPARQVAADALDPAAVAIDADPAHLAAAITYRTISTEDPAGFDPTQFTAFHEFLATTYPRVHARLTREVVGSYSLLYTWPGIDQTLEPILFMGHMDVVPVEEGTESRWSHPPFDGAVADGFVWGRGALDNKVTVISILDAAEALLEKGFTPRRTILLAFGHDEELGGDAGAGQLAATIAARTPKLAWILDEGGFVASGIIPGLEAPAALLGIAEKSSISVELIANAPGGHSSMPPKHTAIGTLAAAIARLEENQMPMRFTAPTAALFESVSPEFPFAQRMIFANMWLFKPVVLQILARAPTTNATIRTTTAPTIVGGGTKVNVLPGRARGVVNFRILPGDSSVGVLAHVRRVIADSTITVRILGEVREPSPTTPTNTPEFEIVERSVRQGYPTAIVAPFLMIGGTDTRHFESLTRNIFRLVPARVEAGDATRAHGANERMGVDSFRQAVRTYAQLMLNGAK